MTKWQWITNLIIRIMSFGLHPGRCGVCGSWLHEEMIVPSVPGVVCYKCDTERMVNDINKIDEVVR